MVTRTGGRLPWPRLVITPGGTSMPVAVLPLSWMTAWNFMMTSVSRAGLAVLCGYVPAAGHRHRGQPRPGGGDRHPEREHGGRAVRSRRGGGRPGSDLLQY